MEQEIKQRIDQYVDAHREEIIEDLRRLVRIPSVSKPGSPEPMPFGENCARVLEEAIVMAREKGMEAKNYGNWYGLASRKKGRREVGIFSHLDVVEVDNDWTFPPFDVTEYNGWLIGRGVADDKFAAILGIHTSKALDELGLAPNLGLLLFLGVNEEKGMSDIERYLQEQEPPEFNLVPDYKFPGSIGEPGVMKFKLQTERSFSWLSDFKSGAPSAKLPLEASATYSGAEHDVLLTAATTNPNVTIEQATNGIHITAKGHPDSDWGAADSQSALPVMFSFLLESNIFSPSDESCFAAIVEMTGCKHGECFDICRQSELFGITKCTCRMAEEINEKLIFSFDVRYPFEITGDEIREHVATYASEHGFQLINGDNTAPWLLDGTDPRLQILCDCWKDVSGNNEKMGVGGGTYARKLKNAVSYGPKDANRCPFLPMGHGEIHCPDEARRIETLLNAVKVYIRVFTALDAYYSDDDQNN